MKGGIVVCLAVLSVTGIYASISTNAPEARTALEVNKPVIEVVFVLDTTGSMSSLIQSAKEKIWAIANTLATADTTPEIRMGLVGYRDRHDAYVTKFTQLTRDLDAMYGQLMGYQAQGGGDGPESVNQALHEAVTKTQWSTSGNVYKVVFLVGDYPPHMDYRDDVKYTDTCKLASKNGIIINTILCGNNNETVKYWTEIAKLAEGRFFRVQQDGGAVRHTTPYDAKIASLSRKMDDTRVYYGTQAEKDLMSIRTTNSASLYTFAEPAAVAQRAVFNARDAGVDNFAGHNELVTDINNGTIKLEELPTVQLPDNMKKMALHERKEFVKEQAKKRVQIQNEINELGKKRQAYIADKVKKEKGAAKDSLDHKLYDCIRDQAAKKNIQYNNGPEY
jgi:Mg-chelatase subunit ChlD